MLSDEDKQYKEKEKRRESGKGKFSDENIWYALSEGTHQLRVLPPDYGDATYITSGSFAQVVYDHWSIPGYEGEAVKGKFRCPERTFPNKGIVCPVCRAMTKLYAFCDDNDLNAQDRKALLGKHGLRGRAYCNVISRDSSETKVVEVGNKSITIPMVWIVGLPMTVYSVLRENAVRKDKRGNYLVGDFTDPEKGFDVIVSRSGEGLDTKYTVMLNPQGRTALIEEDDAAIAEGVLRNAHEVARIFKEPSAEELNRGASLADGVIGVMSLRTLDNKRRQVATAEPAAMFKNRPECFNNHVPTLRKCKICPVELDCESDNTTKRKTLEDRIEYHSEVPF